MDKFTEIKEEILRRAKKSKACVEQYIRALESQTLAELAQVIKDNFTWCCNNKVLDVKIIEKYKTEFASVEIYANESISSGYVVIDGEVEQLSGNALAYMCDNATVTEMCDNATVTEMWGYATVTKMCDNATVTEMWGYAYISTYNYIECKISGNAIMRVRSENKIYTNTPVEKPEL